MGKKFGPDNPGLPFGADNPGKPGRVKGSRNRLSERFIADLQAEWEQHGPSTLRIARIERPVEFCKMVASILPKEFEISDTRMKDLSDDELDFLIGLASKRLGSVGKSNDGTEPTTH
jgi:hypothetical protein